MVKVVLCYDLGWATATGKTQLKFVGEGAKINHPNVQLKNICFVHGPKSTLEIEMDSPERLSLSTQNKKSTEMVQVASDILLKSTIIIPVISRYQSNGLFCKVIAQRRFLF